MSTNSQEILLNNLSNVNDINNTSVSWIKFERFNLVHVLKKGKYKLVRNEKSPEVIKDFIISLRDNYPFTSNDDSYKKIMEKSLAFSDFELSEMFGTIAKMRDQFKAEDVWVFEITFILAERNEEHLQTIDFYIEYFSRKSLKEISKSFLYSLATMKNKSGIIRVGDYYNKSKSKYIQKESLEILKAEAITRGVSLIGLTDSFITNFGFDKNRSLEIEYDSKVFSLTLTNKNIVLIKNQKEKIIKNLPKPSINGYETHKKYKNINKDIKSFLKEQSKRITLDLKDKRSRFFFEWKALYIENPLMNIFAENIFWGIYTKEKNLKEVFRYNSDKTFSNLDNESIKLNDKDIIIPVSPNDLDTEQLKKIDEAIDDFEIVQPFKQF